MMVHKLIPVALVAALFGSLMVGTAAPAVAADDVEFIYFPHQGLDVEFSNDWGRPRDGGERTHKGNDIFSPKGTPVVAVADGFIKFMGKSERPGFQVRLRHAGGWESWYFHLNNDNPGTDDGRGGEEMAFAEGLEQGMWVAAGTVIGYVGDSGNAEPHPSHTHFELRRYGVAINPYYHLRTAWVRQERIHKLFTALELS